MLRKIAIFLVICLVFLVPAKDMLGSTGPDIPGTALSFTPNEVEINPEQPVIYLLDVNNRSVHAFNYQTKKMAVVNLNYKPRKMTLAGGKLYVTLSLMGENPDRNATPSGQVAVIDLASFTLQKRLPVQIDPYDIAVAQGFMFISPNSVQMSNSIFAYSAETGLKAGQDEASPYLPYFLEQARLEIAPSGDRLYVINPAIINSFMSPADNVAMYIDTYVLKNGIIYFANTQYDSDQNIQSYQADQNLTAHDPFQLSQTMKISPDGKYLFNRTGVVFDAEPAYVTALPKQFTDLAFDLANHRLFTADADQPAAYWGVTVYDYNLNSVDQKFKPRGFIPLGKANESIKNLFYRDGSLITIIKNFSSMSPSYRVCVLPVAAMLPQPVFGEASSASPAAGAMGLDFTPAAVLPDPEQPVIYFSDYLGKRVLALNYQTGKLTGVSFDLFPKNLTINQKKLYVSLLPEEFDGYSNDSAGLATGKIGVIDTQNMKQIQAVTLDMVPWDMVIDQDGYLIVTPAVDQGQNPKPNLNIFDAATLARTDADPDYVLAQKTLALSPVANRLYAKDNYSFTYYDLVGGKINAQKTTTFYTDFFRDLRVSPDGQYVVKAPNQILDKDLNLLKTMKDWSFADIAFGEDGRFYTADILTKTITVHQKQELTGDTFAGIGQIATRGFVHKLFRKGNSLVTIQKGEGGYFCEVIPLPAENELLPVHPVPDTVEILGSSLPAGATNVPVNVEIALKLNQTGSPATGITFRVKKNSYVNFDGDFHYDGDQLLLKLANLSYNAEYTLTFESPKMKEPYVLNFQTGEDFPVIQGEDRYATSIRISQKGWDQADTVVLATGAAFPDALGAAPLAQKNAAPLLLTPADELLSTTVAELTRLQAQKVILIGGYGAISQDTEDKLTALGLQCQRLAGADRYETSLLIAQALDRSDEAFIVTGRDFPDALSVAAYAAAHEIPIVLTNGETLSAQAKAYLAQNQVRKAYVIGGQAVVAAGIVNELPAPERIAGENRYETNLQIVSRFNFDLTQAYVATGKNFPDALAGSVLAARTNSPLILFAEDAPDKVKATWNFNKKLINQKVVLGGTLPVGYVIPYFQNFSYLPQNIDLLDK
jgi:putative cell wall-binding protein